MENSIEILGNICSNDDFYQSCTYDPFRSKFHELEKNTEKLQENNPDPIPNVIHQFWIGDKPFPDLYQLNIDSCRKIPGFEHKFWTNQEIDSLLSDSEKYRTTFSKIPSHDIAVKKDFLSYLALKKFGGVTLDASIMCINSPQNLHSHYSFYVNYHAHTQNNLHAIPVVVNILTTSKNNSLINYVVENFDNFVTNFASYNQKYTALSFPHRNLWHGWLSQILVNEAIYQRCFINQNKCNDVYSLTGEDLSSVNQKASYFLDTDNILLADMIHFKNGAFDIQGLFHILNVRAGNN